MPNSRPSDSRYELPGEADSVPDTEFGVYAFRLAIPNDARLGYTNPAADPETLKLNLLLRAERLRAALNAIGMSGQIATDQALHIRHAYLITASQIDANVHSGYISQLVEELGNTVGAVQTAAAVLRYSLELSMPVYIGMTAKQTFRQRLQQHMTGNTQFSERLQLLKISFSDLHFLTRPLDIPRKAVLAAEKVSQSLLRPRVSLT